MNTTKPVHPRRALVESVAIVLNPRCLRLPAIPTPADPARPWRIARLSCGQLWFRVDQSDGVPVRLIIPRQAFSIDPPRWLAPQTIPIVHDLIAHPAGVRRRPWFLCPACERRCARLYLPDGQNCFACRLCCNLEYDSRASTHWRSYRAARNPFALGPRLFANPSVFALCLRWSIEGKGRKRYWRGAEQVATGDRLTAKANPSQCPNRFSPSSKPRGRPRAFDGEDIDVLRGKVRAGLTRGRIAREFCVSRQTINKYVAEYMPIGGTSEGL
jgi:hypothetical protein